MKTRKDSIIEYANAFREDDGFMSAAAILYRTMEDLFSLDVSEDLKIRCVAEQIDDILCGHAEAGKGKGGAV